MHKGASRKQAIDAADLAELVDIHRRLQRLHASLNYASPQVLPLLAASATVKAAWCELSGEAQGWSYPVSAMPIDGIPARAKSRGDLD